ncbi:hypothetical protein SAMN05216268_13633 [Streptomyces yunnanensis]|uniref:Uncharacterized protein n=1 Tax=Streptomyces yunnanensis TaxID=156453 RepID=A0A9X8N9B2_9ACTN|nr:hypothetical protein SAMN05216268_13633 [Streptomyces yunnanensis]
MQGPTPRSRTFQQYGRLGERYNQSEIWRGFPFAATKITVVLF